MEPDSESGNEKRNEDTPWEELKRYEARHKRKKMKLRLKDTQTAQRKISEQADKLITRAEILKAVLFSNGDPVLLDEVLETIDEVLLGFDPLRDELSEASARKD